MFERSRAGYRVTELGERFCRHAAAIENELQAARGASSEGGDPVSGWVRISAVDAVLHGFVLPVMATLRDAHPQLRLELAHCAGWGLPVAGPAFGCSLGRRGRVHARSSRCVMAQTFPANGATRGTGQQHADGGALQPWRAASSSIALHAALTGLEPIGLFVTLDGLPSEEECNESNPIVAAVLDSVVVYAGDAGCPGPH